MAALPFGRQKKKAEGAGAESGSTAASSSWEVADFFSNDPRCSVPAEEGSSASEAAASDATLSDEIAPEEAAEPLASRTSPRTEVAEVTVAPPRMTVRENAPDQVPPASEGEEDHPLPGPAGPGWYPDPDDPSMMRYWDGYHMTGQAVRVGGTMSGESGRAASPAPSRTLTVDRPAPSGPQASAQTSKPSGFTATADGGGRPQPETDVDEWPIGREELSDSAGPTSAVTDVASHPSAPIPNPAQYPSARPVETPSAWTILQGIDRAVPKEDETTPERDDMSSLTEETFTPEEHESAGEVETGEVELVEERVEEEDELAELDGLSELAAHPEADPGAGADGGEADRSGDSQDEAAAPFEGSPSPGRQQGDRGAGEPANEAIARGDGQAAADWVRETERAVARAQAAGTPEAWGEAARSAAVVAEMAQIMQAAADATQVSRRLARAAKEAVEAAETAARAASEAEEAVQVTTRAAQEAAEAARVAERAAADARRTADQTAEAKPRLAEAARQAEEAAQQAEGNARELEDIVARARRANTPEAWSEALRQVEARSDAGATSPAS